MCFLQYPSSSIKILVTYEEHMDEGQQKINREAAIKQAVILARNANVGDKFAVLKCSNGAYNVKPAEKLVGFILCVVQRTQTGVEVLKGHGYTN